MKKHLWKIGLGIELVILLVGLLCILGVLAQIFLIFTYVSTVAAWVWLIIVWCTFIVLLFRYVQNRIQWVKKKKANQTSIHV
ncbi:hypothetical protein [Listeria valentina]|uniref:hypothetical protein n=1 Tax=Listeria valentina TaxID=2705293 RepID=UPI00142F88DB|nr:hypothetical protein [Listeria valentina]